MRRVLIVHYHFLPVHNVAVKQLVGYLRHLPTFGWEPVVLTREWRNAQCEEPSWGLSWEPEIEQGLGVHVQRVSAPPPLSIRPAKLEDPWLIRKARTSARMLLGGYPDNFRRWTNLAVRAARALARSKRIHSMITYCPPETNHIIGSRLARTTGLPWIPFFGDLYGFLLSGLRPGSLAGAFSRACHHWWMRPAAACIAVSPYMAEILSRTYGKRAEVVLAGYDPNEFPPAPVASSPPREHCIVSHIGSLYPGDQRPEIFFDGLDRFLEAHPDAEPLLKVRFVGSKCDAQLKRLVQGRPSARVCIILPKVESPRAVEMVRESDALLAFNCTRFRDKHGTMSHPTKIFEAFGARRPILAMPSDGDWVDSLLARTGGGLTATDARQVSLVLEKWFSAWRESGKVPYNGRPEILVEFTQRRQTERLAETLDVAGDNNTSTYGLSRGKIFSQVHPVIDRSPVHCTDSDGST